MNTDPVNVCLSIIEKIQNPVLFDVGASRGAFSILPLQKRDAIVYAFEPNQELVKLLSEKINILNLKKSVFIFNCGLSNIQGTAILKIPKDDSLATIGTPLRFTWWVKETNIEITTIDNFANLFNISKIDVIKIDVEGNEKFVLLGGEQSIKKFRPFVIAEYYEMNTRQFNYLPEEIDSFFSDLNYKNIFIDKVNKLYTPAERTTDLHL